MTERERSLRRLGAGGRGALWCSRIYSRLASRKRLSDFFSLIVDRGRSFRHVARVDTTVVLQRIPYDRRLFP